MEKIIKFGYSGGGGGGEVVEIFLDIWFCVFDVIRINDDDMLVVIVKEMEMKLGILFVFCGRDELI